MKPYNLILLCGTTLLLGSGCKYFKSKPVEEVLTPVTDGTYCFLSAENKDTTRVSISIKGDVVEGSKTWQPYEKDGGAGTLKGTRKGNVLETEYAYMIEGSKQKQPIRFLLNGDKLTEAKGELEDTKVSGVLAYKDTTKLTFEGGALLTKVDCPPPVKAAKKPAAKAKGKKRR
jgi:hypothetical protein